MDAAAADSGRQRWRRRTLFVLIGLWAAAEALVLWFSATYVNGLRCDESCNENLVPDARTPGWRHWAHSWQWDALPVLAALAVIATAVAWFALVSRKSRSAAASLAISAILAGAWLMLAASGS